MKSYYFETASVQAVITPKRNYSYLYVTRKSLKWMRVFRVENLDYNGKPRFASAEQMFNDFIHLGAGINMNDTCFECIETHDFKD